MATLASVECNVMYVETILLYSVHALMTKHFRSGVFLSSRSPRERGCKQFLQCS